MAGGDVLDLWVIEERVINRQIVRSGDAENRCDAVRRERLD